MLDFTQELGVTDSAAVARITAESFPLVWESLCFTILVREDDFLARFGIIRSRTGTPTTTTNLGSPTTLPAMGDTIAKYE